MGFPLFPEGDGNFFKNLVIPLRDTKAGINDMKIKARRRIDAPYTLKYLDKDAEMERFTVPSQSPLVNIPICDERKIIKLHNAIKVFSQKARHDDINYNALVFEGKQITPKVLRVERIYVMGHPKETDLRAIKRKLTHPNRQFLYSW